MRERKSDGTGARLFAQAWGDFPPEQQAALAATRDRVLRLVPSATVDLSWGMPTFRVDGEILLSLQGFARHNSVFPGAGAIDALGAALEGLAVTKGTIHFDRDAPMSSSLVRAIVAASLECLNEGFPKASGAYKQFSAKGVVTVRGKFKSGERHGWWEWYSVQGVRRKALRYRNGKVVEAGQVAR